MTVCSRIQSEQRTIDRGATQATHHTCGDLKCRALQVCHLTWRDRGCDGPAPASWLRIAEHLPAAADACAGRKARHLHNKRRIKVSSASCPASEAWKHVGGRPPPEYTGSAEPAQKTAGTRDGTGDVVGSPGIGSAPEARSTCLDQSTPMTLPAVRVKAEVS